MIEQIRETIVCALEDADAVAVGEASRLPAFEEGREDIPLADLGLDSIQRMELLVVLEMEHGAVIPPRVFAQFETLGDIASHVAACAGGAAGGAGEGGEHGGHGHGELGAGEPEHVAHEHAPPVVRLLLRVLRACEAVAQWNKGLETLEHHLTPLEFATLRDRHARGELLPAGTPTRFAEAFWEWIDGIDRQMLGSGKAEPEPFVSRREAPAATHFEGPGARADKTLIVCFPVRGGRRMWMPHAVLLQHVDAREYDLLILADPWRTAFRKGVPQMGDTVIDVVARVGRMELLREYRTLRTMGFSGGGYPAMLTARHIGAELAVCVAGRFPSERHLGAIFKMIFHSWVSALRHRKTRVLMAYNADKSRDRAFARRLAFVTGANRLAVGLPDPEVGHRMLSSILEHGHLSSFLESTLFLPLESETLAQRRRKATVAFASA